MSVSSLVGKRLPETFRALGLLRTLNVLAVGLSLSAMTGATFSLVFGGKHSPVALITGLPTLVFGLLWAVTLRHRATIGKSRVRWGWIASIPLAMTNAATACGLLLTMDRGTIGQFFGGMLLGATFGAICWVPALMATLICFGLPIAWSQKLARKGLAGEERGELVVGAVSAAIALLALPMLAAIRSDDATSAAETLAPSGQAVMALFGVLGAAAGIVAAALAYRRERGRRAFVQRVEAGAIEGFRIDATAEGKVLVRVTSMGEGYRVANFDEPVYGLDEAGEAQRSMAVGD